VNPTLKGRAGMTLIEMLVALTVFSVVIAGAFSFLRSQSRGFSLGSERAAVLQNLQYSAHTLEVDLRTLGSNVPDGQPFLVYAGENVVAFNADYTTNIANDPWAVYYDRDAPTPAVTALTQAQRITIPTTGVQYPDTSYRASGGTLNSPAETVIFYFTSDSTTTRADDFVLFRKVNGLTPEVVARNLLRTSGQPFFKYFQLRSPLNQPAFIFTVPSGSLPMRHSVPLHGTVADTGTAGKVDSLRGLEVNLTATNGKTGADERTLAVSRTIRFPNAGIAVKRTCGDPPLLGTGLVAANAVVAGAPAVQLTWNQATDEGAGEEDVTGYVVWRRLLGAADWDVPYVSFPAGQANYTYVDLAVTSGDTYEYALAAQDCTPTLSQLAISAPVAVP
jgi:prepilin-type N-terminal cleavage/methylation domain-containing protein